MKNNLILKHISNTSKILMILLVMLFIIAMTQGISIGISQIIMTSKYKAYQQAHPEPVEDEITRIRRSSKNFMSDGTVHQLVYEETNYHYHQEDAERRISIYDTDDKRIWQGLQKDLPYEYLSWPEAIRRSTLSWWQMYAMLILTPDFSGSIEFAVRQNDKIKTIWRYLPEQEYFIAYDFMGGIAGYLGSTGFTKQKAEVTSLGRFKCFNAWCPEGSVNPVMLWQTYKRIYQIDFQKQTVKTIFKSDKEIANVLLKNWRFAENNDANDIKYRPTVLLETVNGNRHLIMRRPEQAFTFTPPKDWDLEEQSIAMTATENDIYLLRSYYGPKLPKEYRYSGELVNQWWRQRLSKTREVWQELYTINEKGDLNLVNRYEWTVPPSKAVHIGLLGFANKVRYFVSEFSPPVYNIVWSSIYKYMYKIGENGTVFNLCVGVIEELRSRRLIINWSVSFVFVLIALWHGYSRRTNWSTLIMWLAVVALFNIAGFLTYWALNHTTLIKCPVCGKKRHLAQPKCIRCGSDLPVPESKPTDLIFT